MMDGGLQHCGEHLACLLTVARPVPFEKKL
jgi:hypothetical protein